MAEPILISKHQLAELLGEDFKVSWVEDKCRTRQIPHLLIGGRYAFTEQHVAEILRMHERRPETEQPAPASVPMAPQRRTRAARAPLPMAPAGSAPLRDRGLPLHRLRRTGS